MDLSVLSLCYKNLSTQAGNISCFPTPVLNTLTLLLPKKGNYYTTNNYTTVCHLGVICNVYFFSYTVLMQTGRYADLKCEQADIV